MPVILMTDEERDVWMRPSEPKYRIKSIGSCVAARTPLLACRPRPHNRSFCFTWHSVIQAHIEDHTLSATTETAKEAFGKAVEWQVVHRLTCVTISDGVRSFTITDFASAMAFLEIANTVGATSDRRPKVQE